MEDDDNYGLYKEKGICIEGKLKEYAKFADDIDSYNISLRIDIITNYFLLGTQLIAKKIGGRDERRVFIQIIPFPKDANAIIESVYDFFLSAQATIGESPTGSLEIVNIASEKSDFDNFNTVFIEESKRLMEANASINKEDVEIIIGRILQKQSFRIQYNSFNSSIVFLSDLILQLKKEIHLNMSFVISSQYYPNFVDVIFQKEEKDSDYNLSESKNLMTPPDIRNAQKFAHEFKEHKDKYLSYLSDRIALFNTIRSSLIEDDQKKLSQVTKKNMNESINNLIKIKDKKERKKLITNYLESLYEKSLIGFDIENIIFEDNRDIVYIGIIEKYVNNSSLSIIESKKFIVLLIILLIIVVILALIFIIYIPIPSIKDIFPPSS